MANNYYSRNYSAAFMAMKMIWYSLNNCDIKPFM